MRLRLPYALMMICAASGCVEDVPLAAECPPAHAGPCIMELDGGVEPSAEDSVDAHAAHVDAGKHDSMAIIPPPDAGTVVWEMPAIGNPSFEFANGGNMRGDVTTLNTLQTNISPWYTCQPIGLDNTSVTAVTAETGLDAGDKEGDPKVAVLPSDGDTFITMRYLVNFVPMPLLQPLTTPLLAGHSYAFVVDVLSTSVSALYSVELRGNERACLGADSQQTLFRSAAISAQSWQPVCVRFTAPQDLPYLILAATPPTPPNLTDSAGMLLQGDLLGGPRLMFDHIRPATASECPGL